MSQSSTCRHGNGCRSYASSANAPTATMISIEKAVAINEAFQISRQFWAHQVERGVLRTPRSFINTVPHMSFVWGEDNVNFLRARYAALQQSSLFRGMRYSEDHAQIKEWAPLVMEGRDPQQKVAATRTEIGTDVNYGEITRQLIASLQKKSNFSLQLSSEVRALKRNDDNVTSHNERIEELKASMNSKQTRMKELQALLEQASDNRHFPFH